MDNQKERNFNGKELKSQWDHFVTEQSETSFKDIYNHYYHYFFFIGSKKGFHAELIKDTINELFLYVWENAPKLNQINHHHNYLTTIFLRKLLKNEETNADDVFSIIDLPEAFIVPSSESLHIYNSVIEQKADILKSFVNKLPSKQRLMIYQKFYLGMSYPEIALHNEVSINTVYNTVYKAISKLKTDLGPAGRLILLIIVVFILCFLFFF
ncbi:sigma-70 family RNA polymerase sigma factor [Mucilaginibacter sp. PAMB04274]|uniref:RNA polymerase sigma factor n=1 Tax=Mucilaginibacter sp. PAMB04274 TaxID=3138568 RepID=UPI0031F6D834